MANTLTDLITSLKVIPIVPRDMIAVIEKIAANSVPTEELTAGCVVTVISAIPGVMKHNNNFALKRLCLKLQPTELPLSDEVRELFYQENPVPKPRVEIKRQK
jgi:hypothetical protein